MKTEPIAPPEHDVPPVALPKKLTPRQLKRARRRRALRGFWAQFRENKMGTRRGRHPGVLRRHGDLLDLRGQRPPRSHDRHQRSPPGRPVDAVPARHRSAGHLGPVARHRRFADLPLRRVDCRAHLDVPRDHDRPVGGLQGRVRRWSADAPHRRVPRAALARLRDRARRRVRAEPRASSSSSLA